MNFPLPASAGSFRKTVATGLTTALLAAGLVAASAPAAHAAPAPGISKPPVSPTLFEDGRYIVTLADDAASTYDGGIQGLTATKPEPGNSLDARTAPVENYVEHLEETQSAVADSVGADIAYSYTLALNGFSADLTAEQAARLSADRKVSSVTRDELQQVTATPSTEFLGLEGDDGVWAAIGGVDTAGEGIVLGVLDTGIAPENPSFAGEPLGYTPGEEPYRAGETIVFEKADGQTFSGVCETGAQFGADDCNTKVIGARYYVDGFGAGNIGDETTGPGEFLSPRDGDGHGSHTASTAAGNHDVAASVSGTDFGTISGVAPAAKISSYKVCWSGPDPVDTADDGCATSDLVAAIDQSVADGVDVINFSIGGGAAQSTIEVTDEAFLGAAAAGIFVSASAGNAGPGSSTLDNASPWITTVAASTIPSYEATATLGNGEAFAGASITVDATDGAEPLTGPLVTAASVALDGAENPNLCGPGTLDPALAAGTIVLCERGVFARVDKSVEVARAGGIGMLLVNVTPGSVDLDDHAVPTIHLDAEYYDEVTAYAETAGATVTFTPENTTDVVVPAPQLAGFSSRGPVLADGSDILKPDITAPGVAILAATANQQDAEGTYAFLSGTSMAAPHIAGLALLYLGERPEAAPSEIKSAMMTTAYDTVAADGSAVTDPLSQGAGHVDPTRFFEPGLLYLNGLADWLAYAQGAGYEAGVDPIDPSNLNLASIAIGSLTAAETVTRTVTSTQAGTFTASIDGLAGVDAVVSPSTLTFGAAGEEQSYTVTFTRTDAPLDAYATGSLSWTSGDTVVRSPIAVQPVTLVAPDEVTGEGIDGSVDVQITPGGTGDIPLAATGLAPGVRVANPDDPGSPITGSGAARSEFLYEIDLAAGLDVARFDLDSIDDSADLDLVVQQLDESGTPIAQWVSATAAADERVTIENPDAATYLVIALVYAVGTDQTTADFVVTSWSLAPGTGEGNFTVTPDVVPAVQGVPVTYTASWSGLAPETTYLGLVTYGDTGQATYVSVDSGEATEPEPQAPVNIVAPEIRGNAVVGKKLTATPGEWDTEGLTFAYQWFADGVAIDGATDRKYRVTAADQGTAITVTVTATAEGRPAGTATSAAVVVKYAATVAVNLNRSVLFSWQRVTVDVRVDSAAEAAPTGTAVVHAGGRSYDVALDESGRGRVTLPAYRGGIYLVNATYSGDDLTAGGTSAYRLFWVLF